MTGLRTALLLALTGFCLNALAQAEADSACSQEIRNAWTPCQPKGAAAIEECVTEKVGASCLAALRSGNADAACNQQVQDATLPCVRTAQPAIMECLSAQTSAQCRTQLGTDAQKLMDAQGPESCAQDLPEPLASICKEGRE